MTIGILILFGLVLIATRSLALHGWSYIHDLPFVVFGAVIGAMTFLMYKERKATPTIQCGALALIVTWSASLSKGYNTPALAMGPLVLFLIAYGEPSFQEDEKLYECKKTSTLQHFFQRHM